MERHAPTGKAFKARLDQLKQARAPHEAAWAECYAHTLPERGASLSSSLPMSAADAKERNARIYDATAGDACTVGAATIVGDMTPSNAQWVDLENDDREDGPERAFLSEAATFIWKNVHSSNFDAESMDAVSDSFIAGWFVLFADEAKDGGFTFETWPIGQCYVASSQPAGRVDTVYRVWECTVSQAVADYGIDSVSEKVRTLYLTAKLEDKVQMLHVIEPRALYVAGSRLAKNMPFGSYHVELEAERIVREGGFWEFPCAVPRWSRLPGSAYAVGPMMRALPDTKTLQEVVKLTLLGGETALAPPMVAEDDGVLNPRNIKMGPRKIIVANSVDSIKPLVTGAKVDFGNLLIDRLQGNIRRMLMADQLPPADGPVKTAYEWSVRVDTIRKVLGPMFGRFQAEWLAVMVARLFGIAWRANERSGFRLLGRPPENLNAYTVRYLSALARAQRMEEVGAIDRYETALGAQAQIAPSVLDVWDADGAARERGHLLGVPARLIRDKRATEQIRAKRQEAEQRAQQSEIQAQGQVSMQDAVAQRVAAA